MDRHIKYKYGRIAVNISQDILRNILQNQKKKKGKKLYKSYGVVPKPGFEPGFPA